MTKGNEKKIFEKETMILGFKELEKKHRGYDFNSMFKRGLIKSDIKDLEKEIEQLKQQGE